MPRSTLRPPTFKASISGGQVVERGTLPACVIAAIAQLNVDRCVFIRAATSTTQVLEIKPDGTALYTDQGFIPAAEAPSWVPQFLAHLKSNMPTKEFTLP